MYEGFEKGSLDLSVQGSSAPIHSSPPKSLREYKIQRRTPQERKREALSFPVEKIVYLSERLELTSLSEKKIKSVSLSAVSSKEVLPLGFSLDLSSISNDSDYSDEEFVKEPSCYNSASITSRTHCETSRLADCSSQREIEVQNFNQKSRTCDLINVYVNSGNNQDLFKYFRPCSSCRELCCVCPDLSCEEETSGFERVETPCSALKKNFYESDCCSCEKPYKTDFFLPCCGIECRCTASDDSVTSSRSGILAYTSSLANAARSARVLARDLEVISNTLSTGTD